MRAAYGCLLSFSASSSLAEAGTSGRPNACWAHPDCLARMLGYPRVKAPGPVLAPE